jgi:hypothetical protein
MTKAEDLMAPVQVQGWAMLSTQELEQISIDAAATATAWGMLEARVASQISNNDALDSKSNAILAALVPTLVAIGAGFFWALDQGCFPVSVGLGALAPLLLASAIMALIAVQPADVAKLGLSPEFLLLQEPTEPIARLDMQHVALEQWRTMRARVVDLKKMDDASNKKAKWLSYAQKTAALATGFAMLAGLLAALAGPGIGGLVS